MHHDEFHYVSLALDERGAPYVGTGAEGRVYTVDDAHTVSLVADTDERQIGAIGVAGKTRFVVGSDPAVFHRVLSIGGAGRGVDEQAARRGPARALRAPDVARATGPARGLDALRRHADARHDVERVERAHRARAVPRSEPGGALRAGPRAAAGRERRPSPTSPSPSRPRTCAPSSPRSRRTRRERPTSRRKGVPASGGEPPKHDSVVHVTWKVDNPDSDELRYRVQFRREGQARWLDATPPDRRAHEARARLGHRVAARGQLPRARRRERRAREPARRRDRTTRSRRRRCSSTTRRPSSRPWRCNGRRLRAEVVDGLGPIARVEVAVDGRVDWRPVLPVDGIFDTADEAIDADITPLVPSGPGPHVVAVRAFDAAGNAVVREVESP